MRCVSSATCTFVEPVSDLLAPCLETISVLASFVRPISPPCRQSQQSAGSRRKAAAAVAGQGSSRLSEERPTQTALRDEDSEQTEGQQIREVEPLGPADRSEVERAEELVRVVEGRNAHEPLQAVRIGRDREEGRRE